MFPYYNINNDPSIFRSNLELQKSQIERRRDQARLELARLEESLKVITIQLDALNGQLERPEPSQTAASVGTMGQVAQMLKDRGVSSGQLQTALASQEGQDLLKICEDELFSIAQKAAGDQGKPAH